jgi:hypothetical protein
MAKRKYGSYGGASGYGRNTYSGTNIITRRDPHSKPMVDFSKELGTRMQGWFAIHKEQFDKIDERISSNKQAYLTAMDDAQAAIYSKDGIQGHQKEGTKAADFFSDSVGKDDIAGESADLQAMVEDYRKLYLESKGIRKNKKGRLVGFGKSAQVSGGTLEKRNEANKMKLAMENAAGDKALYKEKQNALYNDMGELNIISAHTDGGELEEYEKFMHPDNKTRYDRKTGNMFVIAADGEEKSMKEIAKFEPKSENKKLQTDINATSSKILTDKTGQFIQVDSNDGTSTPNEQQLSQAVDSMVNNMTIDDIGDVSVNHSWDVPVLDESGNPVMNLDGTPQLQTVNYFNSDPSQAMQLIYQGAFEVDRGDENSMNYQLIGDRGDKVGAGKIAEFNAELKKQLDNGDITQEDYDNKLKQESRMVKDRWFNDKNFILDKDLFVEGSDARKKLITSLEAGGLSEEDLNKTLNFLNTFEAPSALSNKSMSIARYHEESFKKYYRDAFRSGIQANIDKSKVAARAGSYSDLLEHNRDMDKKWGPQGPKVSDLVRHALNFKSTQDGGYKYDPDAINIERFHNLLTGIKGADGNTRLSVKFTGDNIPTSLNQMLSKGDSVPSNYQNLKKGDIIELSLDDFTKTTQKGKTVTEEGKDVTTVDAGKVTERKSFRLRYTGDIIAFHTAITNFLAGAEIETPGSEETGKSPLPGIIKPPY